MVSGYRQDYTRGRTNPRNHAALVLNADYRPLSYFPLSLWSWQASIKAAFLDRVDIVSEYDRYVRSPSTAMKIPSVVALRQYVRVSETTAFTRFNLFLRDEFACQYCGDTGHLTFDHVIPRSRGGKTKWDNVVAACASCNHKKGARSLADSGMELLRMPRKPTTAELLRNGRKYPPDYLHESWLDFLYWDTRLEE